MTLETDEVINDYKPGYLAFHELPVFLKAWSLLTIEPDVVVFDGHGKIHPRRMGLASHASFFIKKPTIGIAKNPFIGTYIEPENSSYSYSFIEDKKEIIGAVLRTVQNKKPIFVSVGNYCTLQEVIDICINFSMPNIRIPLVTNLPDLYTKKLKNLLSFAKV